MRKQSMWQFFAAIEGYREAHDPNAGKELSATEEDELWDWLQAKA